MVHNETGIKILNDWHNNFEWHIIVKNLNW